MEDAISFLNRRWTPRTEGDVPRELVAAGRYSPHLVRLLAARGIRTPSEAEAFLDPGLHRLGDPFRIHQMDAAAARIADAVRRGEPICVYGDYDVDGQTSVALLLRVLKALGGRAFAYIPNRMEEGYGLNAEALRRVQAEGATLVVTVDCGVTSTGEAIWAKQAGLDLVITDHHQPGPDLPDAIAVVNPKLGAPDALLDLAGCGVAFKLAEALGEALGAGRTIAHPYVDLAAVGTVADVVPLQGENRSIVRAGLDRLNTNSVVPGLLALKHAAGIEGDVTVGHIGYGLGPRLNAAGRIADASAGVQLLSTDDYDEALPIARRLDAENEQRRRIERQIVDEADRFVTAHCDLERDRALVAWGEGWHVGVIGIAASRIGERYYRPTVILSIEGELVRGSGRSIPELNLYEALAECADLFEAFGGHEGAAGLTLKRANLEAFAERFKEAAASRIGPSQLVPALEYDDVVEVRALSLELLEELAAMEPFGVANPSPVFVCEGVTLRARPVGKDGSHLKITATSREGRVSLDGIAFGMAEKVGPRLEAEARYDIAFVPEINAWNGRRTPSMQVKDVRLGIEERSAGAQLVRAARESAATFDDVEVGAAWAFAPHRPGAHDAHGALGADHPADWSVVDCRGRGREPLMDSLARAGRPVYVITGSDGLRVAGAIAALGHGERTAIVEERFAAELPDLVEQALAAPGWIAVVPSPPGPRSIELLGRSRTGEGAKLAAVLWEMPSDALELFAHVEALRRLGLSLDLFLAFAPRDEQCRLESIARRLPDRDRLGRMYLSLKGEVGVGGAFTAERAHRAVEGKWPAILSFAGVCRAIDIFAELDLVERDGEEFRLAAPSGGKVDLEQSLRYNECTRIRKAQIRSLKALEDAPPDTFLDRLWEFMRHFQPPQQRIM